MNKPSILSIVGERIELRRAGKEFVGLCPFHAEKTPSFFVNEEKGVFLCRGCQQGGDVVDFVMKLDGLSFPEACKALGITNAGAQRRAATPKRKAASLLAGWLNTQHLLVGVRLRELSQQMYIAQQAADVLASLEHEWEVLEILHDDLQNPKLAAELWESRESIETLTAGIELDPLPEFPPLTNYYREYLRALPC